MTWPPVYLDLQSGRLMDGLWRLLLPGRLYTEEPSRLLPLPCRYGATFSENARICVRACACVCVCVCEVDQVRLFPSSNSSEVTAGSLTVFQEQGEWDLVSIRVSMENLTLGPSVWDQVVYTVRHTHTHTHAHTHTHTLPLHS